MIMVFCYRFYVPSTLGRVFTAFPVRIVGDIIKNFSDLNVFLIYVIVIFNSVNFPDLHLKIAHFFQFCSSNSQLMAQINVFF